MYSIELKVTLLAQSIQRTKVGRSVLLANNQRRHVQCHENHIAEQASTAPIVISKGG